MNWFAIVTLKPRSSLDSLSQFHYSLFAFELITIQQCVLSIQTRMDSFRAKHLRAKVDIFHTFLESMSRLVDHLRSVVPVCIATFDCRLALTAGLELVF